MKLLRWLTASAAILLLMQAGNACIEELDLQKMISKTDVAVQGTITDVRTVKYTPENDDRLIYTILTIEGTSLYDNSPITVDTAFLGGTFEGESMMVTSMPAPSEYRLGNDVVVFSGTVQGWGPDIDRCVYASMGGIFRTIDSRKGAVVLGKGKGFAIEGNQLVSTLISDIAKATSEAK
ncbi:MAG: hypothetical protein P8L98_07075 [Planctomycetota bacterium]|nr:hypothetical protein [Planctomycetota bacterium]MDG2310323.1 hypothetical protein [Planctomycetota bacterium]